VLCTCRKSSAIICYNFFSSFFSAEKMQTIGSEREEAKAKKLAVRVQRQAKTI